MALAELTLSRRLPWLLVFRAAVASLLLGFTLVLDYGELAYSHESFILYGVVVGNFLVVLTLGTLLRAEVSPVPLAAAYLALAVMSAFGVVQATGGIDSGLSFLYLLAVIDGAIIGARAVALVVAVCAWLAYGSQLVLQLYGVWGSGHIRHEDWVFTLDAVTHASAFFAVALLAGHLAALMQRAAGRAARAEDDLRVASTRHALVLESLPVGVVTLDAVGVILTANAAASHILGDGAPSARSLPAPLALALGEERDSYAVEVEVGGSVRSLAVLRSRAQARRQTGDDAAGVVTDVLVIEDRTEVVRLNAQLATQAQLAALGQLAAAIAHEIRNPLAAISGSLELLVAEGGDGRERAVLGEIIGREVARLERLVSEFLQFARPQPLDRTRVDVAALAREVATVLQADERCREHRLLVEGPERLVADVDAAQLRQVLWNLLRNAVEASPTGAPVRLCLAATADGVRLEVLDEGAGLAPEIAAHLFEPFCTTKASGTGLGLAVVRRIVEGHGGRVALVPRAGVGTAAVVELPAA